MDQIADRSASPEVRRRAPASAGTIFALASGAGRAAVAVMRLSGPDTGEILASLCRPPPPRRASLRGLRAPDGEMLDRALVLWLPAPASYTGEDCAELFLHGGHAVIDAVSEALVALGARPAEAGEFTRRAFLNGRMDLLEAEAVADLVEAETGAQRRQALRQLEGELGALYRDWADRLRRLLANAEAAIDFSDQDLPEIADDAPLEGLRTAIAAHLADDHRGERLRDGLTIVVAGPPNAGKSSLINALSGREVAIVSPAPGTTRDTLETRVVLGGLPVTLIDTAGLRESTDPVEAEGVRRARTRAAGADLVLILVDCTAPVPFALDTAAPVLAVANKTDLAPPPGPDCLAVSALTGAGLPELRTRLAGLVETLTRASGPPPLTRARHRAALCVAEAALAAARTAPAAELRAEELRLALAAIGRITGSVSVEDILDTIFSSFCIGK
ncbi:MAG TPA: tRNA uridine-5-carboxymethylaminomethyl(34) synthesis GTPase MnmE [Acetobacteraceae bacterium]|nr:tRNA uridine-5-carboxymethylaminomethyl(34) synthesis GTPase MnmE [Acetobacteraceae bacterium]